MIIPEERHQRVVMLGLNRRHTPNRFQRGSPVFGVMANISKMAACRPDDIDGLFLLLKIGEVIQPTDHRFSMQ